MNETFVVIMACILAYVQFFNKIAGVYFDSGARFDITVSDRCPL